MLICLCKGVSDKKILDLIDAGAKSLKDIMASCKAGSDCGSCVCHVKELLMQNAAQAKSRGATDDGFEELERAANE